MAVSPTSLLDDLERLVTCESPSDDLAALGACARVLAGIVTARLGTAPEIDVVEDRPVLRYGPVGAPVLLLGHLDTVHPHGTLARVPYGVHGGRVTGPGVFDMKAGLVQAVHAIAATVDRDAVRLLVTSDEETGSHHSRAVLEEEARRARAVFVLEASVDGRLKTARKGVSNYRVEVVGRAAHAGLEPEKGVNACVGLAEAVLATAGLADPDAGTTVTPTVASAGTTTNTVPATASLALDVRAATVGEQGRVDSALHALTSPVPGARLVLHGGINRPPLEPERSERLFALARRIATELDRPPLEGAAVGGGSDGNFTAALGVDTLDGLGAVGAGAHTDHEWVDVAELVARTGLVARLIEAVAGDQAAGPGGDPAARS